MRHGLALMVLVEHGFIVLQGPEPPPPLAVNGWSLSFAAVNGFFVLSGFLIANSLERRRDPVDFALARMLRIWPALCVLALTAVLVIGPVVTDLSPSAYWGSLQTWTYPMQVMGFLDTSQGPAGVFAENPWSGEFSATLWTLRYEVLAYGGAAVLFFSPLPWGRYSVLLLTAAMAAVYLGVRSAWPDAPALIELGSRLATPFLIGMAFYHWRHQIPLLPVLAVLAAPLWLLAGSMPVAELFMNLVLASVLFWLGLGRLGGLPKLARMPDWSYGLYIWHYPVMQTVVLAWPDITPAGVLAIALPVTLLVAAASWYGIEKPALALKSRRSSRRRHVDDPPRPEETQW
ncbi:acyltransferase family protein [Maricaulis sp. CAU 1757]